MAPIFQPQPLAAPLNDDAIKALQNLLPQKDQRAGARPIHHVPTEQYNKSRDYLKEAANLLTTLTGDLNDRAYELKTKHLKAQKRRRDKEDQEDGAEDDEVAAEADADAKHEAYQQKVEALTKKMDLSIRGVIDDMSWLAEYPETLKNVIQKAEDSAEEQRRNFQARSPTPTRRAARKRRISDDDDEAMGGDSGERNEDDGEAESSTRPPRSRQPATLDPSETPHSQLSTAIAQQTRTWTSQTLTDKYAKDNVYKGWKKVLWDSHNPGEHPPPIPHESLWFAAEEGRSATTSFSSTQQRRGAKRSAPTQNSNGEASFTEPGEDDDDELEIAGEHVRIKCPITLLPFKVPVTSKNCNHSFERAAIMEMLNNSHAPLDAQQEAELQQIRDPRRRVARREDLMALQPSRVKCPDAGCHVYINGEEDLFENQALQRRVARLLSQQQKTDAMATSDIDEDEDDEDDVVRGTQRKPVGLGSSPVPQSAGRRNAKLVKNERVSGDGVRDSVVPDSQFEESMGGGETPGSQGSASRPPRGTQIVDLEDDE